jgi:hypothetical protein
MAEAQFMFPNIEQIQKFNQERIAAVTAAASTYIKGLTQIADETAAFSKNCYEASNATAEKFFGAKSLDEKITIQTDFAKTTSHEFVAQATKLGALYADLAKDAFKPFIAAITEAPAFKAPATKASPSN